MSLSPRTQKAAFFLKRFVSFTVRLSTKFCFVLLLGWISLVLIPGPWLGASVCRLARWGTGIPVRIASLDLTPSGVLLFEGLDLSDYLVAGFRIQARVEKGLVRVLWGPCLVRRRLVLGDLRLSGPSAKVSWEGGSGPGPKGAEKGSGRGLPRLPLEIREMGVENAELGFTSPWFKAGFWGLALNLKGLEAESPNLDGMALSWKGFQVESPRAGSLLAERGNWSLSKDGKEGAPRIKGDLPFELKPLARGLRPLPGRLVADLTLPPWAELLAGRWGFSGGAGLSLGGHEAARLAAHGDSMRGNLTLSMLDLPLGRFLDFPEWERLRLRADKSRMDWDAGKLSSLAGFRLSGVPTLPGAAGQVPDLVVNLGAHGRAGQGALILDADGKLRLGQVLTADLFGHLSVGKMTQATLGLGGGTLDLLGLGPLLPIPKTLSLDGLAHIEGPHLSWDGQKLGLAAGLESRGMRVVWMSPAGEPVTATQEGFGASMDATFRIRPVPEIKGSVVLRQERQVLAGYGGVLEIPRPGGTLIFEMPLGMRPRLEFSLEMRHAGTEPPASLLRMFSVTGEASLGKEGLIASFRGGAPDLGLELAGLLGGGTGHLDITAAPGEGSLRPYVDRVKGKAALGTDWTWGPGRPPGLGGADLHLEGLRVTRRDFDSGLVSGLVRWRPEEGTSAPVESRLEPWTRDLVPVAERGTPVTIQGLVYGDLHMDLELLTLARGMTLGLPEISGHLRSGKIVEDIQAEGDLRVAGNEGIAYRLEFAVSPAEVEGTASGGGLAFSGRALGLNAEAPDGQVNITQITGRDLAALLLALDPAGKNEGIVNMRRKLALGFLPHKTGFSLRHGQAILETVLRPSDLKSRLALTVPALRVEFPFGDVIRVFLVADELKS